jgi:hypothetical protein
VAAGPASGIASALAIRVAHSVPEFAPLGRIQEGEKVSAAGRSRRSSGQDSDRCVMTLSVISARVW